MSGCRVAEPLDCNRPPEHRAKGFWASHKEPAAQFPWSAQLFANRRPGVPFCPQVAILRASTTTRFSQPARPIPCSRVLRIQFSEFSESKKSDPHLPRQFAPGMGQDSGAHSGASLARFLAHASAQWRIPTEVRIACVYAGFLTLRHDGARRCTTPEIRLIIPRSWVRVPPPAPKFFSLNLCLIG